jgi:hypothetical protein
LACQQNACSLDGLLTDNALLTALLYAYFAASIEM